MIPKVDGSNLALCALVLTNLRLLVHVRLELQIQNCTLLKNICRNICTFILVMLKQNRNWGGGGREYDYMNEHAKIDIAINKLDIIIGKNRSVKIV